MNLPIPLPLIVGPIVAALVTQGLRFRQRLAAIVGAVLAWVLAWWVTATSTTDAASALSAGVFGQSFMAFLWTALGGVFLLTLLLPQSAAFVPGGLLLMVPVSAALMTPDGLLRPPLLLLAMGVLAMLMQTRQPNTQAAMMLFSVAVPGTVLLLLAEVGLQEGQTAVLPNGRWFLLAACMLFLGGFPGHFWIQWLAEKVSGPVMLLAFAWMPLVVMFLLHEQILQIPALWQDSQFTTLLQWSGVAAALLSALVIFFAPTFSRLVAGLLLLDMGITLPVLSLPGMVGWQTAVSLHLNRFLSLLIMTIAWHWLKASGLTTSIAGSRDVGRQAPFGTFLFIFGCFSLVGLPLTPGFSGRWALMASLSQIGQVPWWVLVLLLTAMVGAALGILRHLAVLVQPMPDKVQSTVETRWIQGAAVLLLIIGIIFAAFPQLTMTYAARIVGL